MREGLELYNECFSILQAMHELTVDSDTNNKIDLSLARRSVLRSDVLFWVWSLMLRDLLLYDLLHMHESDG